MRDRLSQLALEAGPALTTSQLGRQEILKMWEGLTGERWVNHDPAYQDSRTIRVNDDNGITLCSMAFGTKEDADFLARSRDLVALLLCDNFILEQMVDRYSLLCKEMERELGLVGSAKGNEGVRGQEKPVV